MFSFTFILTTVIEKWFNDVLWGLVFNFLFSSLCEPCGRCSDRARVSNGSAGNGPGTSTIKPDELLAPKKRQERVLVCFTVKDAAEVSSSNFERIGPAWIATIVRADKTYSAGKCSERNSLFHYW